MRKASSPIRPSRVCSSIWRAAYKAGDFAAAAGAFNNALRTREVPLQQSAYYNLGNTLFRQGEKSVAEDPQATIKTWQQSLGAFDTALQLQPSDADAKFNRNVVKARLEELQRQQQQQQKQNRNDKDNKSKPQDQKDQKDQKGQQNQNGQQGQPQQQNQQGQSDQHDSQNQPNQQGQQPTGPTRPEAGQQADQRPQRGSASAAQDIGKPGQLSQQEAEELLDSAKGEERHLAAGVRGGKPENAATLRLRDW